MRPMKGKPFRFRNELNSESSLSCIFLLRFRRASQAFWRVFQKTFLDANKKYFQAKKLSKLSKSLKLLCKQKHKSPNMMAFGCIGVNGPRHPSKVGMRVIFKHWIFTIFCARLLRAQVESLQIYQLWCTKNCMDFGKCIFSWQGKK